MYLRIPAGLPELGRIEISVRCVLVLCASLTNFVRREGVVSAADVVQVSAAGEVAVPRAMLV